MIKRIELCGYKRFSLNQFERIEIDFTAVAQVILGTNGSGKSSLLEQLSPLPAIPADFSKNGYKVIHIEHNHKIYKLSSKFGTPHPHSFLVDDEEFNTGGTITVQRELVKQHFGYTPELHHLLLGKETFDKMSPTRRKDVFVKLCDENYEYAIRIYNALRDRLRDVSGAIKIAKATLAAESEKLILEDEEKALVDETAKLHEFLSTLLENRKPVESPIHEIDNRDVHIEHQLLAQARTLDSLLDKCDGMVKSIAEYDSEMNDQQGIYLRESGRLEHMGKELNSVSEKIRILQQSDARSIEELDAWLQSANQRLKELLSALTIQLDFDQNAIYAVDCFNSVKDQLVHVFAELPKNVDKQYSQVKLTEARDVKALRSRSRDAAAEHLHKVNGQIQHQEKHRDNPDLSCPKCSHSFSTVFRQAAYENMKLEREEVLANISTLDKEIVELDQFIERCATYGAGFRQFHQISQANQPLSVYWNWLREEGCLDQNPDKAAYLINRISSDLSVWVQIQELSAAITDKTILRANVASVGSADLASLLEQRMRLNDEMSVCADAANQAQLWRATLQGERNRLQQVGSVRTKLSQLMSDRKRSHKERMETMRRLAYNEMVRQVQNTLATKEKMLGSVSMQKNLVANLSQQVDDLVMREKSLSVLVKRMSPTEGLIAEGLFGFLKNFVDRMNVFIEKVWAYRMVIEPCGFVEGASVDLDWKFPMDVQGHETPIPDISCGSTGQIEMVNLSFKVTAMSYLPQQQLPLFLDEFGRTLDVSHKSTAMAVVRNIIEESTFPQVFIISHDFHQYGSLVNSEFTMLNSLNVAPPPGVAVNKHVLMA